MAADGPCRIVICDDIADYRELLVMVLGRVEGVEVVAEASNGQEAVAAAQLHQPDVMLLDIAMPVMDGLEALPHILATSPGTHVIILSGFGSDTMRKRALDGGVAGYLEKGTRPGVIVDMVRSVLEEAGLAH